MLEGCVRSVQFKCLNELIFLERRHLKGGVEYYTRVEKGLRVYQRFENELLTRIGALENGVIEYRSDLGRMLDFLLLVNSLNGRQTTELAS